jgi:cold shock CspA family protein
MKQPLDIRFIGMPPSEAVESVARFDAEGRFGFIRTADGDEYWFSAENVVNEPFESMPVGTQVQFIPEVAGEGRQAKRVSVGKHSFG